MIRYNFDEEIDRRGTDATLYEEQIEKFGHSGLMPMWIADMGFAVAPAISDALKHRMEHPVLGYTTAPQSFWNAITDWLGKRQGWKVERAETDYIPGVKKGLGLCLNYFTKPGDKIVIQPPVYHSFRSVIEGNFRIPLDNPLVAGKSTYTMDFENLEHLFKTEHPSLMIVCNPHNPIGTQWDRETLATLTSLCHRYGVNLISDEIYGDLPLGSKHIPTASVSPEAEEITITIGSPSKTFNIPGLASAWCVIKNPSLREGFFKWLLASEFNTPPLFAVTAMEAAYAHSEEWLDNILIYLKGNADYATSFLNAIDGVKAMMPEAGFGLWTDFRGLGLQKNELDNLLINHAGLALSDGASFGPGGEGFKRINFGMSRSALERGLEKIAAAVGSIR